MENHKKKRVNIKLAVFYGTLSAFSFSVMSTLIKYASPFSSNEMLIFCRFFVGLTYLFTITNFNKLFYKSNYKIFETTNLKLNITRAIASTVTIFLMYYSFRYLPIINVTLLGTSHPIFILIINRIFLNKKTKKNILLPVAFGLIGIFLILQPGISLFNPLSVLPIIASISAAISFIVMRKLTKTNSAHSIMLYYFLLAEFVSFILVLKAGAFPTGRTLFFSLLVGIFGTLYQETLIRAFLYASAKIISPLMYLSVLFSGIFGWVFWGYIPNIISFIGMLAVSGSLFIIIKNSARESEFHKTIN